MALRPLGDAILFAFLDDHASGRFIERNKSGIILTNQDYMSQANVPRWGKALAIGADCLDVKIGDLILIEPGMWTTAFKHDGVEVWKTDEKKVMAITDDVNDTYAY